MDQLPSIGRIVHYVLTDADASAINGTARPCNAASAGQVYPALVVRTFGGTAVNLQVFIDGGFSHWATSRPQSAEGTPGAWHWPPRA